MLDFQVTQANFKFGVAEDQEPHQVPPGTLLTAENVVWKKAGRIEKRFGTTALTRTRRDGGNVSAACRVFARGSELYLIDGDDLFAYSGAWSRISRVPNIGLTWTTLTDAYAGVAQVDVARSAGGLLVHAWLSGDPTAESEAGLFVQVDDSASGAVLIAPTQLTSTGSYIVRVVILGTTAFVLTRNGTDISAYTVDLSALTVSAATNLRTDASGSTGLDACVIGDTFVILYSTSTTTKLYSYNASLVQQATATVETAVCDTKASIDGASGELLYLAYVTVAGDLRFAMHNPTTLAQTVAPSTLTTPLLTITNIIAQVAVCRFDSTHAVYAFTTDGAPGITISYLISSTGSVDSNSSRGTWGTRLVSRPTMIGGRCYAVLADFPTPNTTSQFQGVNTILVEIETTSNGLGGAPVAIPQRYTGKIDHLIGGITADGSLPQVAVESSTSSLVAVPFLATAPAQVTVWRCGVRLVHLTAGGARPADLWRSTVYGQEAYFAGGVLCAYDGRSVFDYAFSRTPVFLSITPLGSGHIIFGTYDYGIGLEYRSAAGVLHRSGVITGTGNAPTDTTTFGVDVVAHCVGLKQTLEHGLVPSTQPYFTLLAVYRSLKGLSILYRWTFEPTYNVDEANPVTQATGFSDGLSENDIGGSTPLATRPVSYTTGGILDDEQPPALTTLTLHGQRLWGIDGSGVQAWYSKSFLDDYGVAPGFSTAFRIQFDVPVTALASVDEKLIAFASDRIWAVLGDGPAPDGSNGDFQVTPVQTSVGCSNPRSVVSMADGVMFLSSRGFYMVTRKLEVVFVGGAVQDQLAAFPNVTSAVLVAKRNEVRFTCNAADGSAGIVLVYNYVQQQWSTARYTANGVYGCAFADACIWQGQWTAATPDGFVLQETEGTYLDGTSWVPMTIETAWISAAGPVGYACVDTMSLGGVSKSNHDLSVAVGFDGESTYAQAAVTFLAGSPVTSIGPLEQCSVSIGTRRRCQAIRFKITDATPTDPATYPVGTGQGVSLDTMGLELGIEKGLRKLPATKKG